jgi:hypothetical protein
VAVAAVFGLHVVLCLATLLIYVSQGGAPIPRYLFSALPVLVLAIAYGLDVLPAALRAAATTLVVAGTTVVGVANGARELAYRNPGLRHLSVPRTQIDALHANSVPAPTAVFAVLLILLVVAIVAVGISVATRRTPEPG